MSEIESITPPPLPVRVALQIGTPGPRGPKGDPGPIAGAIISATPPENPDDGDGWLDSTTGIVSYWDEAQQVWVAIPPTGETPVDGETTETILEKLQGAAADPERIGGEYMPEVIPNVLLELADVSALETALPLGTLGRNTSGRPLYGDGVTVPGVEVGANGGGGAAIKYRDRVVITGAELATATTGAQKLLFEFPVSAEQAVNGTVIRCRGRAVLFIALGTAASIPASRLGMITPAGLALAAGAVNSKLSGASLPVIHTSQADGNKPVTVNFDFGLLINTESAILKMSEVAESAQMDAGSWGSSGEFFMTGNQAENIVAASAAVTAITPNEPFNMGFYFGNAAGVSGLGDWALRYEIEIEIIAP